MARSFAFFTLFHLSLTVFRQEVPFNKAFKQVAEEQTKIEQVRSQLTALEYDSEHAVQTADALDNLPVF